MARFVSVKPDTRMRRKVQPGERQRMAELFVYGDAKDLPVVPPEMRASDAAAADASYRCLRELSSNANARAASMVLAANSALGA